MGFVEIANDLLAVAHDMADDYNHILKKDKVTVPYQRRITIGLYKKMYYALLSLKEDASKGRPEAMHHLKTLVECYIYVHWMTLKDSESRAKFIEAEVCDENIRFIKNNTEMFAAEADENISWWKSRKAALMRGHEKAFKEFAEKTLYGKAKEDSHLKETYDKVYRFACQPAHISDLDYYMLDTEIVDMFGRPRAFMQWSLLALNFGTRIVLNMIEYALNDPFFKRSQDKEKVTNQITQLRHRHDILRQG